jgi:DNA-binding IclR family transcriptional regulator
MASLGEAIAPQDGKGSGMWKAGGLGSGRPYHFPPAPTFPARSMDANPDAKSSSGTQSIQRAAAILRLLTSHHRTGLRLVDLYRKAGLERTTAHRILQGLIAERLVAQDKQTRRYFLGPFVHEMGLTAAPRVQLRDICHPALLQLAQDSGDTVFLTVRSGLDGVCLDRAEGAFPVKVFVLEVGRQRPLGVGGGGLAILSGLDEVEQRRILQANAARLREKYARYDEGAVLRAIAVARRNGYLVMDVLEVPGIRTLAMPILDHAGNSVAALSIATMAQRMDEARLAELAPAMRFAVARVQQQLASMPELDLS